MKGNYLKDCTLLLFITVIIYIPFLGLPGWDGNEPVRVIVAREMTKTGNWAVPVLHGKPYFVKPPLMNWLIAASGSLFGTINEWTSRIPSVIVMYMMSISIYFLTRKWLSRDACIFAAIATLSMVGLISTGRTAEIDSLFVFLVMFTLLIWINGYIRRWSHVFIWGVPLLLLGIGFLAKGPQAIAYFYSTVFTYLALRKRLSFFFSRSHLVGIFLFILILAVYLSFVLRWMTFNEYINMWIGQITQRAETRHYSFLEHFISYPFRIILSFMPWVLFVIPVIIFKDLRKKANEVFKNEILVYSLVLIAVNFPLYWLLPNARVRYFLPAGPFVAIIMAVLFEFYLNKAKDDPEINIFFGKFLKFISLGALVFALIILPVIIFLNLSLSPSLILLMVFFIFLAVLIIYKSNSIKLKDIPIYLSLVTGLIFLIYTDLDIQYDSKKDNYPKKIASEINLLLPEDIDTVYEIGYRRFLGVTCYLKKEVIQLDGFAQLKSMDGKKGKTCFIFDTKFLNAISDNDRKIFSQEIKWEKIYSRFFEKSRGKIVVGCLI